MWKYLYCFILIIFCWFSFGCLLIWSLVTREPNLFQRRLEFQVQFNSRFVVDRITRGIRYYVQLEFLRMISIVRPTLRRRPYFRILEIGVGTGTNFRYYPRNNLVTTVDNNPHYAKLLDRSLRDNSHIHVFKRITSSAEDMRQIPNGIMDCVISTYTLCAVDNVDAVLLEVRRVLKPGGCFLFVEPVSDLQDTCNYFLQAMISPVFKLAAGYDIKRRLVENIRNAGFVACHGRLFHINSDLCFRPHIHGLAIN